MAGSSRMKYGGAITATPAAPAAAACAASASVSAVVCAPQCAITGSGPPAKSSVARMRSSRVSRMPSPVVPSTSRPSKAASE